MKATPTSECGLLGVLGPEPRGLAGVLLVRLTECLLLFRQLISLRIARQRCNWTILSRVGGWLAKLCSVCPLLHTSTGNSREARKLAEVQQVGSIMENGRSRHPNTQLIYRRTSLRHVLSPLRRHNSRPEHMAPGSHPDAAAEQRLPC